MIGGRDQTGDPELTSSGLIDDAAPRAVGAPRAHQARVHPASLIAVPKPAARLVHRARAHGPVPTGAVGRLGPGVVAARPGVRVAVVAPTLLREPGGAPMRTGVGEVPVLPRGARVPPGVRPAPVTRVAAQGVATAVQVPRRPLGAPQAQVPTLPTEPSVGHEPKAGREAGPGVAVPRPPRLSAAVHGAADQVHHAARQLRAPMPAYSTRTQSSRSGSTTSGSRTWSTRRRGASATATFSPGSYCRSACTRARSSRGRSSKARRNSRRCSAKAPKPCRTATHDTPPYSRSYSDTSTCQGKACEPTGSENARRASATGRGWSGHSPTTSSPDGAERGSSESNGCGGCAKEGVHRWRLSGSNPT